MHDGGYDWLGLYICCPRYTGRAPLPDAKRDDASQSCRNTSRAVDLNLPVDQFRRIAATFQVIIGFNVMKVCMRHDKGNHWDRQHGDGGVVDTLGAGAMSAGLWVLDVIMDESRRAASQDEGHTREDCQTSAKILLLDHEIPPC